MEVSPAGGGDGGGGVTLGGYLLIPPLEHICIPWTVEGGTYSHAPAHLVCPIYWVSFVETADQAPPSSISAATECYRRISSLPSPIKRL